MKRFPESEYHVPFFDEMGYIRERCSICGEYYWTLNEDQKTCGESNAEGCAALTFINDPPTRRHYNIQEMREAFLAFFVERGHKKINPYPVVSRWRDDLYFTSASIVDFQPYVTNGINPPPANPLVISQPCIRFVDVDNVGPTFGRHLTIFEMGGHHAFNYSQKEVYWKDQTVRYHHEFMTRELGVKPVEVVYKEGVWSGGGNAGPDLETIVRGLELATLVFMKFKVVNGKFMGLPIQTVDTGYGLERYTWLSQGSISCFHAVYGPILLEILKLASVNEVDNKPLTKVAELSGAMTGKKVLDRREVWKKISAKAGIEVDELRKWLIPVENAFAVADHTKCLAFMLAEGVIPSNIGEGYLTRLMLRRTYRLLKSLAVEEKLLDIIELQIDFWSNDFPQLEEMRTNILDILSVEQKKFKQTINRGRYLLKRITSNLKTKKASEIPAKTLIELYDSHGLPPEIVAEIGEQDGFHIEMPDSFYTEVAKRHIQTLPLLQKSKFASIEPSVANLPKTRVLYYEDAYLTEFNAKVLRILQDRYIVLDKTAFYPEGGGQPADHGYLRFDKKQLEVVDVQKIGNVIVHIVKGSFPKEGEAVQGFVNWERRNRLMKHHTGTHILMGAARRVLGKHVWQGGAQKEVEKARLDISHFRRLTLEEKHEIEKLTNQVIAQNISIDTFWMPREEAEKKYGFRLYQGGVVPGREIRVVKCGDWEIEACGGTHLRKTGEIDFLKIIQTERIQDGVERVIFSVGVSALKVVQENDRILSRLSEILDAPQEKLVRKTERLIKEWKNARREKSHLLEEIAGIEAKKSKEETGRRKIISINGISYTMQRFKQADVDRMIKTASALVKKNPELVTLFYWANRKNARIVVMAGEEAVTLGINSSEIAGETASELGGGGSGRLEFAQGGGTLIKRLPVALEKAEETIRRQIRRGPNSS